PLFRSVDSRSQNFHPKLRPFSPLIHDLAARPALPSRSCTVSTVEATAVRRCEVKERLDGMAIKRAVAFGIAVAVLLLCLPMSALAQGSGGATVTGVIKDASGAVLPGVTVEASSPSLIEKVRTAVSDASGNYRIIELRPGVYTVTYTLPGFTTLRREGIELSTNFTATLNIDMKVGAVAETVTVA